MVNWSPRTTSAESSWSAVGAVGVLAAALTQTRRARRYLSARDRCDSNNGRTSIDAAAAAAADVQVRARIQILSQPKLPLLSGRKNRAARLALSLSLSLGRRSQTRSCQQTAPKTLRGRLSVCLSVCPHEPGHFRRRRALGR